MFIYKFMRFGSKVKWEMYLFLCLFFFLAIPGNVLGVLLALPSGITPSGALGTIYSIWVVESRLTEWKASLYSLCYLSVSLVATSFSKFWNFKFLKILLKILRKQNFRNQGHLLEWRGLSMYCLCTSPPAMDGFKNRYLKNLSGLWALSNNISKAQSLWGEYFLEVAPDPEA